MNRQLNALQALYFLPNRLRVALLRFGEIKVGDNVTVLGGTFFGSHKCEIGSNCFVSVRCLIDGSDWVRIGKNVSIASGVQLITGNHMIGRATRRAGPHNDAPVTIGDGCWLGASCIILPGIMVASGCVIGAGAVVTKDTLPNGVYAGIPARRIRDL